MIFFSAYGVFNASGMEIFTQPGEQGIKMTASVDQNGIKKIHNNNETFNLTFALEIRECRIGEAQIQRGENFICQECAENTFLLEIPKKNTEEKCKPCPSGKAICEGGKDVGPDVNYWRKSNTTYTFLRCLTDGACIGMYVNTTIKLGYNATGNCAEGYYGALCSACLPTFSRSGSYGCEKCDSIEANAIRMTGIIMLLILAVVFLVKSTIEG